MTGTRQQRRRSPAPRAGEEQRAALARERRGRRTEEERQRTRARTAVRTGRSKRAAARKSRPTRGQEIRRRWVALLIVVTLLGLGYLLFFSSLLSVKTIEVQGAKTVSADQIRATAQVPAGQPMLRADVDGIRDRVAQMPGIATVDVSRSWPTTLEIAVTERTPIAFFDSGPGGDGVHLVDGGGVVFKTVKTRPVGLPELKLPKVSVDDPVTRAVTAVLGVLPEQLLKQTKTVTAQTPASVEFTLSTGKTVRWGNSENTDRKAKVLAALLTQQGKIYDVSAPELPTITS
ncbi:cell division protein FtsQ/DivIB [Amycolatopsis circi]|uniref:cell division protein FtsQ/DivIB n=1 Tax=Amycolatopsis circi TaxID=871959 RepID=UPI000E2823F4|nr:FtsQ-type POTRA domain-containing protein [Amycolatopsis circi]